MQPFYHNHATYNYAISILITEKENTGNEQPMDQEQYLSNNNEYLSDNNESYAILESTRENTSVEREEKLKRSKSKLERKRSSLSKIDVDNILDAESMKTMDGCLKILAELHVSEALEESE